jgi:nucleotide-binding universal stress UspA family protein
MPRPERDAMGDHPLLVCYGGPCSTGAVQLATVLAGALQQPLVVTSAYETEPAGAAVGPGPADRNARRQEGARRRVERGLRQVTSDVPAAEAVVPATGTPAAVVALARDEAACLIVMGRDVDGRVTRAVIEQAPCPVAISPLTTAVPGTDALHRIGVAYDGSPEARLAITAAMHLGDATGAAVRIITVGPLGPGHVAGPGSEVPAGVTAEVCRLPGDARTVLEAASADLDLIVCGSHCHGRLLHRRLGSVSSRLVDAARCPVLVVPAGTGPRPGAPLGLGIGADADADAP